MQFKTIAIVLAVATYTNAFRLDSSSEDNMNNAINSGRFHSSNRRMIESIERQLANNVKNIDMELSAPERRVLEQTIDEVLQKLVNMKEPTRADIELVLLSGFRHLVRIDSHDLVRLLEIALTHIEAQHDLLLTCRQVFGDRVSLTDIAHVARRIWERVERLNTAYEHDLEKIVDSELERHDVERDDARRLIAGLRRCFETRSFFHYFAEQCLRMVDAGVRAALPERDQELTVTDVVRAIEHLETGSISVEHVTMALERIVDLMLEHRVSLDDVESLIQHLMGRGVSRRDIDLVLRKCLQLFENRLERELRTRMPDSLVDRLVRKFERETVTGRDVELVLESLFGRRISGADLSEVAETVKTIVEKVIDHYSTTDRRNLNNNDNKMINNKFDDLEIERALF